MRIHRVLVWASVLVITLAVTPAFAAGDAAKGKTVYAAKCKTCHGANGEGNAAIAKTLKVELKHLGDPAVQKRSDADLKKVSTEGTGKMKAVTGLTPADADDVMAFVRTLKK
jgi:mono/diheme cytochrome c family protein